MPEKVLLSVFSFLSHKEVIKCSLVCKLWYSLAYNSQLWTTILLRPEYCGLHVKDPLAFLNLLDTAFGDSLRTLELPVDLITTEMVTELANRCPNLTNLTLDFSNAMQLCDFNDLNVFPCNLRMLCLCLSEVIFLEGFMRRIYTYLSSVEVLHIIGTIESSSVAEEETYETINIHKLKSYTPNLKIINLYGVQFIEDYHLESVIAGCIHLECLCLNYCTRFKGAPLKLLISRCRKIQCLLLRNTGLQDSFFSAADWETSMVSELDITSTDLSEQCLLSTLTKFPKFRYLSVAYCDNFTDKVLEELIARSKITELVALNIGNTVNLSLETVFSFLKHHGKHIRGICYTGNPRVTDHFWTGIIPQMRALKIVIMGTSFGWFKRISTRIHIDSIMESFAQIGTGLERLEIQWDPDALRWTENSSKFVDHISSSGIFSSELYTLLKCGPKAGPFSRQKCLSHDRDYISQFVQISLRQDTDVVDILHLSKWQTATWPTDFCEWFPDGDVIRPSHISLFTFDDNFNFKTSSFILS